MYSIKSLRYLKVIGFFSLLFLLGCKEDDPSPSNQVSNEANAYVNNWIYDQMSTWYLWNDELPKSPNVNQEPENYFDALLNNEDRFSWLQPNYQELLNSLKGISKEAGYEYVLYKESSASNNVIAQILYIKPSSPAAATGLTRGDIITHINNQQLTTSNYRDVLGDIKENHTILYKNLNVEEETFSEPKSASLTTLEYSENPNFLHKVIEIEGKKIGYYVYNLFAGGPGADREDYDNEMDQIFTTFKSADITDLVLDMRFNSGGAETSANNLASLIGPSVGNGKVFAKREYNAGVEEQIINDPDLGRDFLTSKFANKASNVGSLLNGKRVYVLAGSRTASASELVINSLKPYMDVFIIGDTTYGKNVGSISLYEEDDTKNTWGLQPIVVKVYNSLDQSDYGTGFVPNVLDKDNSLYIYPLGDPKEALLSHAIAQITGTATNGRVAKPGDAKEIIGHSLDSKRRSFNLIIDQKLK